LRIELNIRDVLIFVSNRVSGDFFIISENMLGRVSEGIIEEENKKNNREIDAAAVIEDSYELKIYPNAIPIRLKISMATRDTVKRGYILSKMFIPRNRLPTRVITVV